MSGLEWLIVGVLACLISAEDAAEILIAGAMVVGLFALAGVALAVLG